MDIKNKNTNHRMHVIKGAVVMGLMLIANASQAMNQVGFATYIQKTLDEPLVVVGALTGTELTVPAITVTGATTLTNSQVGSATIVGPLIARGTRFKEAVNLTGSLTAMESTFEAPLEVQLPYGQAITLTDTKTKDIVVRLVPLKGTGKQQSGIFSFAAQILPQSASRAVAQTAAMVTLRGNAVVDGNVTFIGGKGTIHVGDSVKITGKIIQDKKED